MDEWWKRTWIVAYRTFPRQSLRLWLDVTSPEENYGLIAFELPEADFEVWPSVSASGRIREVETSYDAAYFHVRIRLSSAVGETERVVVGFDTYDDELGESVLPDGAQTTVRSEFALEILGGDVSQLYVTESYDFYGFRNVMATGKQLGQSSQTDGAPWNIWRWITSVYAASDNGQHIFPQRDYNVGALRIRRPAGERTSLDAVFIDDDTIVVRVPWTLLQYADPAKRLVLHDDLTSSNITETRLSQGIAVVVSVEGQLVETPRRTWSVWEEVPATTEREKPVMQAFADVLTTLPDAP